DPSAAVHLEACMRAAHSLKGAARIVGLDAVADVAHLMEDCFVAAQRAEIRLLQGRIDVLLQGVDLLARIARTRDADIGDWGGGPKRAEVDAFAAAMTSAACEVAVADTGVEDDPTPVLEASAVQRAARDPSAGDAADRVLRITAENFDRLLSLTSES